MKRGDVVIAAGQGDYGKPRPVLVVQSDAIEAFDTIAAALITSTLTNVPNLRPSIDPSTTNGLRERSQVMIDKIQPVRLAKVTAVVGRLSAEDMERVNRSIAVFFGLAD
ncbi:MAG: type II toxin-antitoxin system PemK/MazF family toxin [Devosia nanyangense]|uniref:Type II toxin-antitoxin system PemK/MazF family toxin n=1 Tax=Devosia nanyangense TaxID=1228055 RepID=A0A933NYT7_9HYPH|nr:type II toxin-antitoxin system PemK/MazF family toxin [Devosia nanyangense]